MAERRPVQEPLTSASQTVWQEVATRAWAARNGPAAIV